MHVLLLGVAFAKPYLLKVGLSFACNRLISLVILTNNFSLFISRFSCLMRRIPGTTCGKSATCVPYLFLSILAPGGATYNRDTLCATLVYS